MDDFLEINFPSSTGTGTIQARLYLPINPASSQGLLIQIVHGMAEHMRRYHEFCLLLAKGGFAVCIHDQAGHGASASSPEYLGYFGAANGVETVQQDIDRLSEESVARLKDLTDDRVSWRRVIFGHSMGSFISRLYCTRPGLNLAGAVFSGTSAGNPALNLGLFLANRSIRRKGPLIKDEFLARLSAQGNLKRIPNPRTPFDWLSRDESLVDAYIADPWCGYTFTAAGYRDLYSWLLAVSRKDWAAKVQAGRSVLLISGSEDPIGQYGTGARIVGERLKAAGHQVEVKVYDGARHEVLNETNKLEVWQDVLDWLKRLAATATQEGEQS